MSNKIKLKGKIDNLIKKHKNKENKFMINKYL